MPIPTQENQEVSPARSALSRFFSNDAVVPPSSDDAVVPSSDVKGPDDDDRVVPSLDVDNNDLMARTRRPS